MEQQETSRGRPPKPKDERKSSELRIRLTEEERATLDAAAGEKTSTWARDTLLQVALRQLDKQHKNRKTGESVRR